MQKLTYEEAREWFWVRTAAWCVPAAIVSVIASFAYYGQLIDRFEPRFLYALAAGVGATLLGLAAASLSIQIPWMRSGWKWSWLPNTIICAVAGSLMAALICSVIISVMKDNIYNPPPEDVQAAAYNMMLFAICLSAGWGAVLGAWFGLRFDKYFVESI